MRYVQLKEIIYDGALVPLKIYFDKMPNNEPYSFPAITPLSKITPSHMIKGHYQMDCNTLWLIANGGIRHGPRLVPQGQKKYKQATQDPCFTYGGG